MLPTSFGLRNILFFLFPAGDFLGANHARPGFPKSFVLINAETFLLIAEFIAYSGLVSGVG